MKRKYKDTQKRVDEAILAAIQAGITDNAKLKQVLMDGWQGYNVGELVDCFARTELSAAKQRLRDLGEIEITKGNEPKPISQIAPDDAEFIARRRQSEIAGRLKSLEDFSNKHNMQTTATEAAAAYQQLTLFEREFAPDVAEVEV